MSEPIRHPDDPGEPSTGVPRIAIDPSEAQILTEYAVGKRVLEIGTGLGASTRALAASAISVDTVDIDPWVHATIVPTLPANVTAYRALANGTPGVVDVVFIDGAHDYDSVCGDIEATRGHLAPGGVFIFHDWRHQPVCQAAHDRLPNWVFLGFDTPYGVGVAFPPSL